MSSILIQYILFVVWFVQLDCEVYQDRPKIKTADGDLILQPAFDKSIYLRPNGPKSNIYVGNVNFLSLNSSASAENQPISNFDKYFQVPTDILQRLETLENSTSSLFNEYRLNFSVLSRRFNRLNNRVLSLQTLVRNRGRDECQSQQCQNGGTCLNLVNGYHCLCPSNWEGKNCEIDVNECRNFMGTDLGCQNGATCINRLGSYECLCRPGWFGLHCTRKEKDCQNGDYEMCGHGTCINIGSGKGIKCICDQGWTTNGTQIACLTDVNECDVSLGVRCSVNPKVDCINLPGSFRCGRCPPGYDGDGYVCNDIDECVTIPNGGCSTSPMVTCHNIIGSRICGACPSGYQGDGVTCSWKESCLIDNGGCHPSARCLHSASLARQLAQCICPDGMEGDGIGIHGCYISIGNNITDKCTGNPCGAFGQCHRVRNGYTCICDKGYNGAHCDNTNTTCANNPCANGGTCRLDERSEAGFRCECTALYSGVLCQVHSKPCGGVLDAEEGSIIYPLLSNSTYKHNSRCAWVIHTVPDKVINVTFSKFNIEDDPDCHYDFLQIHDGRSSASQLIGRFCGSVYPKGGNILSSHNNLYFWFRSDSTVAKEGFALHWTSIKPLCGGEIDATKHGHISSPGSPGTYPPNRDCYWHLTATFGNRLQLHFFELDIENHQNCSYDYLAIYDGQRITDPLLDKFCNSTQPAPVQSTGSEILIHFHSDAYTSGHGFQIAYSTLNGVPGCGGYFTKEKGEIISPSYDGKYLNNLLCDYKIKTSPGTNVRIDFKNFQLERSFRCRYDYIKIFDGPSSESPLVGKFCGNVYPKSYTASSNTIFIQFRSDHSMASDGFKISYESICLRTVLGESGIIKSPGYPFSYPYNKKCEYIIGTTPGRSIILTFQDFDLEDNRYNCQYDNVEIRDGVDRNATLLGKFCGGLTHIPPVQTSTLNYMYILFTSDMSLSGKGFYANFTSIDTHCGGIYRETQGTINHPVEGKSVYNSDESCSWLLVAPEGMHIELTWNRFDLEDMQSCISDYVQLIEIDNDNNNTLGTYCGSKKPPALTVTTNRLIIKFQSDSSIQESGFSVTYNFLNVNSHCGGLFVKTHGFIYSPGWPRSYEPNRDCVWIITVPVGQQVLLNITDFDLERPVHANCNLGDYLEIRNGDSQSAPLIGKYCGRYTHKRIVSTANSIYLRFYSDFYISGSGFKIEWDGSISGCGGTLNSVNGMISSPNYPQPYNENSECFYKIVTSSGSRIRINFSELELERTEGCSDDYVEIFDGRDSNAPSFGKQCFMTPKLNNIQTSSNYAFVKFRSDFFVTAKGFLLNYETICNNNVSGNYGVIESPGFPGKYPTNTHCSWTITVPKGNKINITFTHFDVSLTFYRVNYRWERFKFGDSLRWNRNGCQDDYLQIKESPNKNDSIKMCGSVLPQPIKYNRNSIQIQFVSGAYFTNTGFRLEWVKYGCGGHIKKRSGYLKIERGATAMAEELECEWIIESPAGTSIMLNFTRLFMYESANCSKDAIEIYNGPSIKSPLITRICHSGSPAVVGSGNLMFVRFVKKSTERDIYFTSRFNSFKADCGGTIISHSGMIHSKNYPKNYDNNIDCLWYISVPKNHRIELNMLDLDLYSTSDDEDSTTCGDAINIYDGGRVLGTNYTYQICPETNVSQIVTNNPNVAIQFTTDRSGTAKGFKANFTMTCGAVIEAKEDGVIQNDKYISYSTKNCTWTILAPTLYQKIKLTITHMSIPRNTDIRTNRHCPSSFLKVFDGIDYTAPLINEYCGHKIPPLIVSHGNAITIQLGTHTDMIDGHFSAHYSSLTTACGGNLSSEEGSIASPNYPQSYPVDTDCVWILSTSPGNRVYITFEQFQLDDSEYCNDDYLEVRENNGGGQLLGVYCGNEIPANTTTGTKLYIKFHSDSKEVGQGFILHYGFLHGNEITGLEGGEIASPLYPFTYDHSGTYTWRIVISGTDTININIDHLEIYRRGEICRSYLAVYDGYDDDAPLIYQECGIFNLKGKELQTTSSVAFIKLVLDDTNKGSLFHLAWNRSNRDIKTMDPNDNINCGSNRTELLLPGRVIHFQSPNYPNEYGSNLNCEWLFKSDSGRHLILFLEDIVVEESTTCYADYISIYSSNNLITWSPIKEHICLTGNERNYTNSDSYLKVKFITDSSFSLKGFRANVKSICGGLVSNLSGSIGPTWSDIGNVFDLTMRCEWTVKVRPERNIILKFDHFNITNDANRCTTYLLLRNGESPDSPLIGKYCGYEYEKRNDIVSSSNAIFIKYVSNNVLLPSYVFQNFRLHYEEKNVECGVTSHLDSGHTWEVIMSPNYPSVPIPYTECVWKFTSPPGEILRIDFIDRFDLQRGNPCSEEFVEIRDGSSELSPLKDIYCGSKPGTIKTSSNYVYIKYVTQLLEPRDGFKANISIDVCGGTIIADSGELVSPGYPNMIYLGYGTVCEWRIVSPLNRVIKLQIKDLNLADAESTCATKLTIEEPIPANKTVTILKTLCGGDAFEVTTDTIETFTNEVTVKLYIGKPIEWNQNSEYRGFKLTFNSSRPTCGGTITTPEGYLMTPGYPRKTSLRYCQWVITVPDKTRRVRLELVDIDSNNQLYGFYNDVSFRTLIHRTSSGGVNNSQIPRIIESTGNKMALYLWVKRQGTLHRFKARFSSNDEMLCGGQLSGTTGTLASPNLTRPYTCVWQYSNDNNEAISDNSLQYKSIYLNVKLQSSITRAICRFSDSALIIGTNANERGMLFSRSICSNNTNVSFRIPSSIHIKAIQNDHSSINFQLNWRLQPCGGIVHVSDNTTNILNVPLNYDDTLDCAWILVTPAGIRLQIQLEGSFTSDCVNEYLQVSQGLDSLAPIIGDYCRDRMPNNPLSTSFMYTHVQYHSNLKNGTNLKVMVKTVSERCGALLSSHREVFSSPNFPKGYPNSIECTWEILADLGNRISLQFIDRFAIEYTSNCSKDALIIYDWKNDAYIEMARLCGRQLPLPFNSTNNKMKVILRTDDTTHLDGFKAQWKPICGGNFLATDKEQFIYSPGYPNRYLPSLNCVYAISAPEGKISLKFLYFELEGTYPSCPYDNVTIIGRGNNFIYNTYCDMEIPPPLHNYDDLRIIFKTDAYTQMKGFKISYTMYSCGGKVKNATLLTLGTDTYDNNLNCTWLIEAPPNKIVVFKFLHIDLEDNVECYNDYIAVYEEHLIDNSKRLALICGAINNTVTVRSHNNTSLLQFKSDSSLSYAGFKVQVFFSYSKSIGCGGQVNLTYARKILKSPMLGTSVVYENYLDCNWEIIAPIDYFITIEFTSFHVSSCENVNQTAIGFSKCDCDMVELRDGLNPNSLIIGKYCGHILPPKLMSSSNLLSVRFSTDGEINSSGFEATLTVQKSICGQSRFSVSEIPLRWTSPGYEINYIPRGLHCSYEIATEMYSQIQITIHSLDIQAGADNNCNIDKFVISGNSQPKNVSFGQNFTWHEPKDNFFAHNLFYENTLILPSRFELCGLKSSLDFYVYGNVNLNLLTASDADIPRHKGVEIEIVNLGFCGRNYTGTQGRIQSGFENSGIKKDCFTLITAPANHTISIYFMTLSPQFSNLDDVYFEVFDGNSTNAKSVLKITREYYQYPIFSTGRYLLLHNKAREYYSVSYDLNYVTTDRGRGCGGALYNEIGKITSPMHPDVYRHKSSCEWEIHTPIGTRVLLRFSTFDLGRACEQNYVELIDKNGNSVSKYCEEPPADYTSNNNFVKIVFVTTMNNAGTGWVAEFIGVI